MPVTKQHTGRVVAAPARCKRYNIPDSELKGFGLRVEPRGAAIRKKKLQRQKTAQPFHSQLKAQTPRRVLLLLLHPTH